jgi:outer membrane protein insertion porin family
MKFGGRWFRGLAVAATLLCGGLAGGGAGALLSAVPAWAQSASSIVVEGNRRVDAETIRSYFRTQPGERLDALKIDEAYKALLATGMFEDVRISHAGSRLIVKVVESGVINRISFEGNKNVKDEQLSAEIQSKPRGPFSRQIVRADVQRIVDIYHAAGRYDVRVDPQVIDRPNGRVDLVFVITEGKKTGVKDITFVGNHAYSSSRLKDVIKTSETGILSFFRNNDIYDADRVEQDRDLLRKFYLSNGYADVRVASAMTRFDPARHGFLITYTIDEGPQYRFGKVDIQSNVREVDPARLRSTIQVHAGGVYNADGVQSSVEKMSIELAKSGYAFAQVRPRGDRNFQSRTIDLTFVIDQGVRAYIERINIRGNTRTRDYVIRREFDIGEGDAYNHALIDRAERRLKNLGYFKSVKITSETGSAPDRVIINVDVEEQSTGQFTVSGGYSTSDGFMAEVSVGERNLLGRGQYAKATVQYGQIQRGFDLSFVEPYLFDYHLSFGVDVFARDILPSIYQSYELKTAGGGFRFGIPITENFNAQLRYQAYSREIGLDALYNCYPPAIDPVTGAADCIPASAPIRQVANSGSTFTSLIGYTLAYNTLDNNRNAHRGMLLELKQDFAGVGGDVNFIRTTADARWYHDVGWDVTSLVHLQAGHITSWGDQQLSMFDHFFMGPNLVRGFEVAGIGPRDMSHINCPGGATISCNTYDALGGTMYWGASLELQYPLFFAPKDFGMKLATFVDAGSVWGYKGPTTCTICVSDAVRQQITTLEDSKTIRSSVGVGLIWDSPFGPLRFDYAIALTKDDFKVTDPATGQTVTADRTQAFRFSGGTKF